MAPASKLGWTINLFMRKRMKPNTHSSVNHHHNNEEDDSGKPPTALISGLPDHISQLILSKLPPRLLFSVCTSWRRFIYSPLFPPFPSLYALLSPNFTPDCFSTAATTSIELMTYDPISSRWSPLPPPPSLPLSHTLLHHPYFISRTLPIQSLSVSGRLILLAATTAFSSRCDYQHQTYPLPLPLPLVFSPLSRTWSYGPALSAPRRWCAAGTVSGFIFAASGIGSQFSSEVARSFEKWDLSSDPATKGWEKLRQLKDGRFSRNAIDAVGCRGKLWMMNAKGDTVKERAVYDVLRDEWSEMPEAMVDGWRGPAASMDEEEIYVVDQRRGVLQRYDFERGGWVEELESTALRGAENVAAGGGMVCVVTAGGSEIVVVDVRSERRIWAVETPPGYHAVTVHLLPRPVSGCACH